VRVEALPLCWRCPQHVIEAATPLVHAQPDRIAKEGFCGLRCDLGSNVVVHDLASDKAEASFVAEEARRAVREGDVLILLPLRELARDVKRALRGQRLDYDCKPDVEETGLNALANARAWLENPEDNLATRVCIERILDNPELRPRGERAEEYKERVKGKVASLWPVVDEHGQPLIEALESRAATDEDLECVRTHLEAVREAWDSEQTAEFLAQVGRVIRPWAKPRSLCNEIDQWIGDAEGRSAPAGEGAVRVMTMRSAKGLSADTVFVVGLNEGVFPRRDDCDDAAKTEEAQRLLYVSMTRAKHTLHLTFARVRSGSTSHRSRSEGPVRPSPLLSQLLSQLSTRWIKRRRHGPKR